MAASRLPTEVELAYEVMPCLAQRTSAEPLGSPHACTYFRKWGTYHSYDYASSGPPPGPGIEFDAVYRGRATVVPEMVSGCRKAPILAVGINPNLPGWWGNRRNAVVPLFDEVKQFAHYFRYRAVDKLEVPTARYTAFGGGSSDTPFSAFEMNVPPGPGGSKPIPLQTAPQTMYEGYQSLLDGLADAMGWADHKLAVGEDWAYGNMVACASAKWSTDPGADFPPMTVPERNGIVGECFHERRYFLRQLFQSLPTVVFVFSQATAAAFIGELQSRFVEGNPKPSDSLTTLAGKTVRLEYGQLGDGTSLRARVIFSPHVSGSPAAFAAARPGLIAKLREEVLAGNLAFNATTKHLKRPRGGCVFCTMLEIGKCDYEAELEPLADHPGLAGVGGTPAPDPLSDKRIQLEMLNDQPLTPAFKTGWDLAIDETAAPGPSAVSTAPATAAMAGQLLAGEIDPDEGPTYVLRGRIVSMTAPNAVIDNGQIVVSKGIIRHVGAVGAPLPAEFAAAPVVNTGGTIYPGLMDLHNHFVYNVLTLWNVPRKYSNRGQWPAHAEYQSNVSKPIRQALGKYTHTAVAIIRYVEAKALIGGCTTGQGIRTQTAAGPKVTRGAMRNVEETRDPRLPAAGTLVPNLGNDAESIEAFRRALDQRKAYFYHLSEGVDAPAHRHFENLDLNGLLLPSLVGVHSLALTAQDLQKLEVAGSKIVWSPFSNRLLYGATIKPTTLKNSGVPFAIGCDWSPTGSRNLLHELKVADFENREDGSPFTDFELVEAVTAGAARVVAWQNHLGTLAPGMFADLLVIKGNAANAYRQLIEARERDVQLVVVHGKARYGDPALVKAVHGGPATDLEQVVVAGTAKAFMLKSAEPLINAVSFDTAVDRLTIAMADLPAHVARMEAEGGGLQALGLSAAQPLVLALDNEFEEVMDDPLTEYLPEPGLLADVPMAATVALDGVAVDGDADYLNAVAAERNLPDRLKDHLRAAYP